MKTKTVLFLHLNSPFKQCPPTTQTTQIIAATGQGVRKTLHADYKNDKKYSDHQAPNLSNQMASNLSAQARHGIDQLGFNGYVMMSVKQRHQKG